MLDEVGALEPIEPREIILDEVVLGKLAMPQYEEVQKPEKKPTIKRGRIKLKK